MLPSPIFSAGGWNEEILPVAMARGEVQSARGGARKPSIQKINDKQFQLDESKSFLPWQNG